MKLVQRIDDSVANALDNVIIMHTGQEQDAIATSVDAAVSESFEEWALLAPGQLVTVTLMTGFHGPRRKDNPHH